jgi:hypothetical protein
MHSAPRRAFGELPDQRVRAEDEERRARVRAEDVLRARLTNPCGLRTNFLLAPLSKSL